MWSFLSSLPNTAKVFLGFMLVGLLVTGVIQSDLLSSDNNSENELVEVQILVQTVQGESLGSVEVQVITKGPPTTLYTNDSGYTRIEIPARSDVDVIFTKEGYETLHETIDLAADPNRNKVFRLKALSNSDSEAGRKAVSYQIYTTQNEFFPFLLSFLTPDLDIPILKEIFSQSLGIENVPYVYLNSPIHDTIEKFKQETGNKDREQIYLESNSGLHYVVREAGSNLTTTGEIQRHGEEVNTTNNTNPQSNESFEEDKIINSYAQGEEDYFGTFYFAPVLAPLSFSQEDAQYTSLIEFDPEFQSSGVSGVIFQYPKLSEIQSSLITSISSIPETNYNIGDSWIRNVISENPEHRGILSFSYPYTDGYIDYFPGCGSEIFFSDRHTPSLYVRFIDVKNISESPINLNSITYRKLDRSPYQLSEVDQRNLIFEDAIESTDQINVSLGSGKHIFIPIEFGFTTDSQRSWLSHISKSSTGSQIFSGPKRCYIGDPVARQQISSVNDKINQVSSDKEKTEILMNEESIDENFLRNLSSSESLFEKVPARVAIGSLINVESLTVEGSSVPIQQPSNSPTVYVSQFFNAGSCPYLKIYDSKYNNWIEKGTVLYMRNRKSLQTEESYKLGGSITKVLLEERESEITYLDSVSIQFKNSDSGLVEIVSYPSSELQQADEKYLELYQGDSLEIDIQSLLPDSATDVELKINGYYQVLYNSP